MGRGPGLAGGRPAFAPASGAPGADGEDPCSEIDRALAAYLERSPWTDSYDLVTGLVGIGVYALGRLPRPEARAGAERVVLRLGELAEETPEGITWRTGPEQLAVREREHFPDGYYNLGVAHGVPGVIVLLARCVAAGVETKRAARLLEGAVAWVLARRGPEPGRRFPFAIAPRVPPKPARTAWCYGDPGVAAALTLAASLTGEASWARAAATHAIEVSSLEPESCGVEDAGLCHGAMGLAHVCHRLYRWTGIEPVRQASRRWFEIGLGMRQPGTGVAGFPAFIPEEGGQPWAADPGLLGGAAGVALALLAATDHLEPTWDIPLLLSAP